MTINEANDKIKAQQKQIAALKLENAELKNKVEALNITAKRAFWWSAETTRSRHENNITFAWSDFLTHPDATHLKDAKP